MVVVDSIVDALGRFADKDSNRRNLFVPAVASSTDFPRGHQQLFEEEAFDRTKLLKYEQYG